MTDTQTTITFDIRRFAALIVGLVQMHRAGLLRRSGLPPVALAAALSCWDALLASRSEADISGETWDETALDDSYDAALAVMHGAPIALKED